jgi:hypothetical protein
VGQGSKPTLDVQYLQKLIEEASLETAESYAAELLALLPRLGERIVRAVVALDGDLVLDASRNLKSKSWLVGALQINQLCTELELAVALADWAAATATARDIELHLPRLQKALTAAPELAFRAQRSRSCQTAMAS